MSQATSRQPIHLKDYRPPSYTTREIELAIDLDPIATEVTSRQRIERNPKAGEVVPELVLSGEMQELLALDVDGAPHPEERLKREAGRLVLTGLPDAFELTVRSRHNPTANKTLQGLYISNGIFCTQCEPEGFRRITYFQDRPDVQARFKVRLSAERAAYPYLLSNGNLIEEGGDEGGRHWALWADPYPKPAYLFALVAGNLAMIEDRHTTRSGREVALRIYADQASIDQCGHAMASLKKAMVWDEDKFGLEYDLDLYQIVAVSDFNFGAMENKGLNIFNTAATLAKRETATDADFVGVERVIAHEYFHNWTGNRVTCRDWFQLTLKEGLTVFRDQEFTADMHSAAVKRISDVALLRDSQFQEDAGPLSHPIRPDSYIEINNFYTRTVYEKGAEVIRMLQTLIGEEDFLKGVAIYLDRHDGSAATCEDFVAAMAEASDRDFSQFMRWYRQGGTPELKVERSYDPDAGTLTLEVRQTTPTTPGQSMKEPLLVPLRLGLIGRSGKGLPLQLDGENEPKGTDRVIELREEVERFTFVGLDEEPVPSLLRGFSAPVRLDAGYSDDDLALLLARDSDPFVRWDSGQTLALRALLALVGARATTPEMSLDPRLVEAFGVVLDRAAEDPGLAARALTLPSGTYLEQQMPKIDVDGITFAQHRARAELGRELGPRWLSAYHDSVEQGPFSIATEAMARRALKNTALHYLTWAQSAEGQELARRQFATADTMTDSIAALRHMVDTGMPDADSALKEFYGRWRNEALVINKWFALQASIDDDGAVERVEQLTAHPAFTLTNPNRTRAVLGVFGLQNLYGFHRKDGAGYRLLADKAIEVDRLNPQVAARLLTAFGRWRRFDGNRQLLMQREIERVVAVQGLSRDSFEIASKTLAA